MSMPTTEAIGIYLAPKVGFVFDVIGLVAIAVIWYAIS